MPVLSPEGWNDFLGKHPDVHILQTAAWGDLKAAFGWRPVRLERDGCGVQILFRRLPLGFSVAYIPRGPVGDIAGWDFLWRDIDGLCHRYRATHLLVEPDLWIGDGCVFDDSPPQGFRIGIQSIQPPRTIVVNLVGDETELLGRMKQKTRYNIHLAQKHGVQVTSSTDVGLFYEMVKETGARDQFGVHSRDYYRRALELFRPSRACELLLAEYEGMTIAAVMVFRNGARAWYFYGASSGKHREYMPAYLLQWEGMRWARSFGCREYDLWGVPDFDESDLEAQFTHRSDGLWGVYRFKRGFGGHVKRTAGPWERIYQPTMVAFYRWWTQRRRIEA
jgi:lipid II:glycine glycyltransferase (peptidoglycan interpeptide bridge formation enzyme)